MQPPQHGDAGAVRRRWVPATAPQDAGVLVHGPLLLAQAPGVSIRLEHVRAHRDGVMLHLLLHASGVHAEAAKRQMIDKPREPLDPDGGRADLGSQLVLHVELNDLSDRVHHQQRGGHYSEDSTGEAHFTMDADYWIDELPHDGRMRLTTSWVQVGLPEASTLLMLDLPDR